MKSLIDKINKILGKEFKVSKLEKASSAVSSFTLTEKVIFYAFAASLVISAFLLLWKVDKELSVLVPDYGGELTEGIVGSPRFINPLLAISDADRDLSALVYSGLMKATPEGELIPDIAESYSVSPDGLTYHFKIKQGLKFHDGSPVTADDIEFTVRKAQDSALKSVKRAAWDGVLVEKVSNSEIKFNLKQPYQPFLENATLGILPKHIWAGIDADTFTQNHRNTEPVGSGPYKIGSIKRNTDGTPSQYIMEPFSDYALGKPYISKVTFKFFTNETKLVEAYTNKNIESMDAISPQTASQLEEKGAKISTATLPRVFGVFFNQNQAPVFINKEVRQALDLATDKKELVEKVLNGYGVGIDNPIPPGFLDDGKESTHKDDETNIDIKIGQAKDILAKNGWTMSSTTGYMVKKAGKKNYELKFSIATSDAPELKKSAENLKSQWEKIGASVDIKIYETGELNQNIIRPRKYDALLFGEIIGRDLDLYAFWHSSQRNDPGLNIALYTNVKVDKLLEETRLTPDEETRIDRYIKIESEIAKDMPAVFTYSPSFIYLLPEKIKNAELDEVTTPSERFLNISKWYIETDRVWKIFSGGKEIINNLN